MTGLFDKLKRMKIMLIDDDEYIRDSLTMFFEGEGCELEAFETAEEALKVLDFQSYDIIVIDYRLPGIDGLQFLKRIETSHPDAMKILISAFGDERLVREAANLGVSSIVNKPFSSETMEAALAEMLAIDEQKRQTAEKNSDGDRETHKSDRNLGVDGG